MPLTTWRKSSFSSEPHGNCVEVAFVPTVVAVRDSKNTSGPTLAFDPPAWRSFAGSAFRPVPGRLVQ